MNHDALLRIVLVSSGLVLGILLGVGTRAFAEPAGSLWLPFYVLLATQALSSGAVLALVLARRQEDRRAWDGRSVAATGQPPAAAQSDDRRQPTWGQAAAERAAAPFEGFERSAPHGHDRGSLGPRESLAPRAAAGHDGRSDERGRWEGSFSPGSFEPVVRHPERREPPRPAEPATNPAASTERSTVPHEAPWRADGGAGDAAPARLIAAWRAYLERGDGRFNLSGMRQQFEEAGIRAELMTGPDVGLNDSILAVAVEGSSSVYLLPNFTRPVQSVAAWYPDAATLPRGAAVSRIVELAMGETIRGVFQLRSPGRLA